MRQPRMAKLTKMMALTVSELGMFAREIGERLIRAEARSLTESEG